MEPNQKRPRERERGQAPVEPSFEIEEALDHLRRFGVVKRDGRTFFRNEYRQHNARIRREKELALKARTHTAYMAFLWGDTEGVDVVLKRLFRWWSEFSEERQSALREALYKILGGAFRCPASDLLNNPPPWLDPKSSNPQAYLAKRVFMESLTILKERKQQDKFSERLADPLLSMDQRRGVGDETEKVLHEIVRDPRTPIPDEDVATRHDDRVQAIEHVAKEGRDLSRNRAATILHGYHGQRDVDEVRKRMSSHEWRAVKTTLNSELEKIRKIS